MQFLNSCLWFLQTLGVLPCAFSCFQHAFPLPPYSCIAPRWTSCFCATASLANVPVFSGKHADLSLAFPFPASCPKPAGRLLGKTEVYTSGGVAFPLTHKTLTPEIHLLKALGHDQIPFPFQFLGLHLHGLWIRPARAGEGTTEDDINLPRRWDCAQRGAEATGPDQLSQSPHLQQRHGSTCHPTCQKLVPEMVSG